MAEDLDAVMTRVRELVEEHRATALWSLRPDWYPETAADALRALDAISRHGSVEVFQEAARLRAWLSQNSRAPSAVS